MVTAVSTVVLVFVTSLILVAEFARRRTEKVMGQPARCVARHRSASGEAAKRSAPATGKSPRRREDRRGVAHGGPIAYRRIAMVSTSIFAPGRPNPGSGTPVAAPAGSR